MSPLLENSEIADLYDDHFDQLYRFFYAKVRDQTQAEDLTSETFFTLVRELKKREDVTNPSHFLFGIAKNVFLQFLRHKYHEQEVIAHFERISAYELLTESEISQSTLTPEEKIKPYLDQLPQQQLEILKLRLIEKLGPTEIASKIGKNLNYVKVTQKRAIKNLRRIIACTP